MDHLLRIIVILNGFIYSTTAVEYSVDALEVQWNTTTPDFVELAGRIVRPSRGVFGISGYVDIKQDINANKAIVEVKLFYSPNGITYQLSPFRIVPQTMTQILNNAYKDYLMDAMLKCCKNAPGMADLVSPLKKRLMECDSCLFPTDNFPTGLRPGYYRMVILAHDDPTFACSILYKVELDY